MSRNAEDTIRHVVEMDPNDMDYKYDYVLFLFENERFEEAKDLLIRMYCDGIYDLVFHNTYFDYYFIQKYDFVTAEEYCRKTYKYFSTPGYKDRNEFLYNYLFCLKNNKKYNEMIRLENNILVGEILSQEILKLYDF